MYTINNGEIDNKEIRIGEDLKQDLTFRFEGQTFKTDDTFSLEIGSVSSSLYGFYADGVITFAHFDFQALKALASAVLTVSKNGSALFSETMTLTFTGANVETDPVFTQNAGNLATKSFVSSAVSSAVTGLASESFVTSAVSNGVSGLASQAYVTSAVSNGVSGLASESFVSSSISAAVGSIDAVLSAIVGTSGTN